MNVFSFGVPLEGEFWRIVFLMARAGGAFIAAPIFAASGVPSTVRVAMAGAIAIFVALWVPVGAIPQIQTFAGMVDVVGELVIGLSLGFVLQIVFAAPILASETIGGSMGLSMAVGMGPDGSAQHPVIGQFLTIVMTILFFATGGHLVWLRLLIESYEVFPPGAEWLLAERFEQIAMFGATIFIAGLVIAMPISVLLLLVQIVTGVLSRSAPQLNIFSLGLPIGVLAGLSGLIITAPIMFSGLEELIGLGLDEAARLLL